MTIRLILFACFITQLSLSQDVQSIISTYLDQVAEEQEFSRSDLDDFSISNQSYSKSMDLDMVYVQQQFQGLPVHNAIGSFAVKNGQVLNFQHSFVSGLSSKIETTTYTINAGEAIISALHYLNIEVPDDIVLEDTRSPSSFIYQSENLSSEPIPIELKYVLNAEGKLNLAWDLSILTSDESHWWSISIDANNTDVLRQNDWMLSCQFEHLSKPASHKTPIQDPKEETLAITTDGANYRAYPLNVESPNHGNRVLLTEPADPVASPLGWHDTDGIAGPEFSITRGNNVAASEDRDADNTLGYSPDGGADLNFDFPLDFNLSVLDNEDAAITNLFVWNNYIHDVWYHYGFDEASGNFQETNYTDFTGSFLYENDYVIADAQDGSGVNNANFATPTDGFRPRMQMFLWTTPLSELLTLNTPSDIAGIYFGSEATFGPELTPTPITSDLVLVEDDNTLSTSDDPHNACDPLTNAVDISGKIAVINRGECTFVSKINLAQSAGAIAVIIINNAPGSPITMGGDADGDLISIPSIMISQSDGNLILDKLQNDEIVNVSLSKENSVFFDSNFDNGIIAHEYAHGISNRLTGGASQVNCLFNDDQMGEGWSDWIGLMLTMTPGDTAEQSRGIGTFVANQSTTGTGIRPQPYSTDAAINSVTFGDTNNSQLTIPHGVGFVWASMLWDLTWELIDQYGFDPNLISGSGGNNLAMQLVTDAMKLQNCNPGFVDGRNAILQADMLANNGANRCYIWKVFANRGLGFSADQGSSSDRFDQVEAYDLPDDVSLPCQPLAVEDINEHSLKIYPNPVSDVLNIESINKNIGVAKLKIYDINGRLLSKHTLNFNQKHRINLSSMQSGIYVLKIENRLVNFSKKLIIK